MYLFTDMFLTTKEKRKKGAEKFEYKFLFEDVTDIGKSNDSNTIFVIQFKEREAIQIECGNLGVRDMWMKVFKQQFAQVNPDKIERTSSNISEKYATAKTRRSKKRSKVDTARLSFTRGVPTFKDDPDALDFQKEIETLKLKIEGIKKSNKEYHKREQKMKEAISNIVPMFHSFLDASGIEE
eukprot:TRINITY_DN1383_c0_g1_i1.p2 TRINITY_DN1383_c0_g1~~TRINITY_DN1383_c0_g1_i1.p2  ORF type:complete len:182 (-),score=54.31 TRINITY_DN1383_c0_g1_i1:55-600(-)